jgi:hypothetical protein
LIDAPRSCSARGAPAASGRRHGWEFKGSYELANDIDAQACEARLENGRSHREAGQAGAQKTGRRIAIQ